MYFRLHRTIIVSCLNEPRYLLSKRQVQSNVPHVPVMVNEVLSHLKLDTGATLIDMTFGAGGHSLAALKEVPNLRIFALDRDPEAQEYAKQYEISYPGQVIPLKGKFSDLPSLLKHHNVKPGTVDGILFDLGCSSMQMDRSYRGFALSRDGPLDMRMEPDNDITAADLIAHASSYDLAHILKYYGEEKYGKLIASAIVESRYSIERLSTTQQLAKIVELVTGFSHRQDKLRRRSHIATKVFQALRIFVNNEINELNYGLLVAHKALKTGGRLAALSFHSLEDRVVKRHLQDHVVDHAAGTLPLRFSSPGLTFDAQTMLELKRSRWKIDNAGSSQKFLCPTAEEVERNPRARSAKLRFATKT